MATMDSKSTGSQGNSNNGSNLKLDELNNVTMDETDFQKR